VAVAAVAIVFLLPLLLLVSGSLRPTGASPRPTFDLVPAEAGIGNYGALLTGGPFAASLLNSILIAGITVPVGVLVASWCGYAIARLPRTAARILVAVAVVAAMVPATSLLVGRVAIFRLLGVSGSPAPLVAPALVGVSPLLVLWFAWSYARIPAELYDFARQAGYGPLACWRHVALPLRPGTAGAAAAVAFVLTWGNFLDPLIAVYDERWYTVPLTLRSLSILPPTDQPLMLAGATIAILPVVVVLFLVARRLPAEGGV
jgi:multiple sugar transport system permease protein